eukprot:11177770-Lingulodinium_polyedra.AAC.1
MAVTANPQALVDCPGWAIAGAMCAPAGGDGYAYVCQTLLGEGQSEEPTVVVAFDLSASAA